MFPLWISHSVLEECFTWPKWSTSNSAGWHYDSAWLASVISIPLTPLNWLVFIPRTLSIWIHMVVIWWFQVAVHFTSLCPISRQLTSEMEIGWNWESLQAVYDRSISMFPLYHVWRPFFKREHHQWTYLTVEVAVWPSLSEKEHFSRKQPGFFVKHV